MSQVGLFKRGPDRRGPLSVHQKSSPSRLLRCTLHFRNGSQATEPSGRQRVPMSGIPPTATEFCSPAKCREGPLADIALE
jgi:hypothetical protein